MAVRLDLDTPPDISLLTLGMKRGRLAPGATIPEIVATARRLDGDLAAYRAVCGFPEGPWMPATWPAVCMRGLQAAVMTAPAFPLPVLGIVHVRQEIAWTRPLRVDEPLSATCRVEGHRVVRAGGEFDLELSVRSGDEPVWTGVTSVLSRAIRGDGEKRPRPQEEPLRPHRSVRWSLPADLGRRYARVSGDWNPIHLHPLVSRPFGFARPIAHGWWLLARALAELDHDVPAAGRLSVRFVSPVKLPGWVTFQAERVGDRVRFEVRGREPNLVGELAPA